MNQLNTLTSTKVLFQESGNVLDLPRSGRPKTVKASSKQEMTNFK